MFTVDPWFSSESRAYMLTMIRRFAMHGQVQIERSVVTPPPKLASKEMTVLIEDVLVQVFKRDKDKFFAGEVDKVQYPDYYVEIERPMDFGTIFKNNVAGVYATTDQFLLDVRQVGVNCAKYNASRFKFLIPIASSLVKLCEDQVKKRRALFAAAEAKSN